MLNFHDIPYLRLHNQGLARPVHQSPAEVVDWLLAVQAQDFMGAKWSVGQRMAVATDAQVERAFNAGAILRTHVLRPTWHFVTPGDLGWLLALTAPRVQAANAGRYRELGLDGELLARSAEVLGRALQGGNHLTRAELGEVLCQAGIDPAGQRLGYMLMHAELEAVICSGPLRGKQHTYAFFEDRAPPARRLAREEALAELARRYFAGRGPATANDLARWGSLTLTDARAASAAAQTHLEQAALDGQVYWFAPAPPAERVTSPRAFLLSVWDEYVNGYQDRGAIASADFSARLWDMGNALTNVLVIDGQVAGTFRRAQRKKKLVIELRPFRPLREEEQRAVAAEAGRFGEFLGLPAVTVA